ALEHYPADRQQIQDPVQRVAEAARQADSIFIPDTADAVSPLVQGLVAAGLDRRRVQLMGTGLWDDPKIFADASLQGAWFAAPDPAGYRNFAGRYRAKFGQDPVRTATLAYDAVSLVAALAKTQGAQRFAPEILTNPSRFSGGAGRDREGVALKEIERVSCKRRARERAERDRRVGNADQAAGVALAEIVHDQRRRQRDETTVASAEREREYRNLPGAPGIKPP